MAARKEWLCESPSHFLPHLELSHSACLGGVNRIPNVMNDMERFHSAVLQLPETDAVKVISCIQECIDHCSMCEDAASQRLKLLRDISSDLGCFPKSYEISDVSKGDQISRGGEARLYIGSYRDRTVVIRRFLTETTCDEKRLTKTIIREVISHWQLRHPNIVALIGVHKFEGDCYPSTVLQHAEHSFAIEYLELHPEAESFAKILLGLFEGVHYLHTRSPPVIHGDLHHRNVVVSATGDCLLCDFGLSRIKHGLGQTSMTVCQGGELRFIAPEIFLGKDDTCVDQQSDIYSLAMTIYALGTRSPPFQDKEGFRACRAAADGERPPKPASLGGLTVEHTEFLWVLMQTIWHQDPQRRPTISDARNSILQSDVMNLVQLPASIAAAPAKAQHPTVAPPPLVADETIQQVPTHNGEGQRTVATSDVPRHRQDHPSQCASGIPKSESAFLLPLAPSPFGMYDSIDKPAVAFGTLLVAGARQFPWPSASSVLRGSPRLQASASGSPSRVETVYVAKNDQGSYEAAAGSYGDSVSGTTLVTGDPGAFLGGVGSVTGGAATSPSLLLSPPVRSLGSSLKSAAAGARSYILSPSPLGRPGTTEPAVMSYSPSPPPTPKTPSDRHKPTAAGADLSVLPRSPLGRLRSNTKPAVAHVDASSPSPPSFEDSGSSLRSAIASARSYIPRDLPLQRFGNLTASTAAAVTASLSSPSGSGNLKSNLKAAAGSYVLSPSPSDRLGSLPEPATGSNGASSSGLGRLGSLKSSVADFRSSPSSSHSFFGILKGSPKSATAGASP